MGVNSHGQEPTVSQVVYAHDENSLKNAISQVSENGTIYIKNPFNITSTIHIDKSLKIQSLDKESNKIWISNNTAFHLDNTASFIMEDLYIYTSGSKTALTGFANEINVENCTFIRSGIKIQKGGAHIEIRNSSFLENSKFMINPLSGINNILLYNNEFVVDGNESIILRNANMEIDNNRFSDYSLIIESGHSAGNVKHNDFIGDGKIIKYGGGEDLKFNYNYIDNKEIYYTGDISIDFTYNWWGSKDGPTQIISENVDYGSWALFNDLTRFHGDPYTLADLEMACSKLGADPEENWLYNLNGDDVIDTLDLVAITRRIQ